MVVGLALVIEAASVVDGDVLTLLRVVNTVALLQSLLFDAHCECGRIGLEMSEMREKDVDEN